MVLNSHLPKRQEMLQQSLNWSLQNIYRQRIPPNKQPKTVRFPIDLLKQHTNRKGHNNDNKCIIIIENDISHPPFFKIQLLKRPIN